MDDDALITFTEDGGLLQVAARGSWTRANAAKLEVALSGVTRASSGKTAITVDMAGVGEFDTFGAWLLERLRRNIQAAGCGFAIVGVELGKRALFDEMASVNLQTPPAPENTGLLSAFDPGGWVIRWFGALWREMSAFFLMTGAIVVAAARTIRHPREFRLTSTVHQFDRVAWQAVPIILMITFLIGVIIAQQGFFQFRRFGADLYVVNMIGFLIMREMGVLLVAIMVAGRMGSSYTAELGSMKMREEIDALKTMGFDPVEILILPRVLVLIVALPALAFIGSIAALFGAGLVAVFYADLSVDLYMHQLREAISLDHFKVGLIKAPFIGAAIGIIACNEGLLVRGSAASLGEHTTRSVVKSIFMIIMLDGLFALFFSAIGM